MNLEHPLTEQDQAELAAFLAGRDGAMDPETLDGFFCALIVCDAGLRPAQWMPYAIGGGELEWADPQAMERTLSLLLRKWNEVAGGFRVDWQGVAEETMQSEMYLPDVDLERDEPQAPLASHWAKGFGRALGLLGKATLDHLAQDEEAQATLALVAGLDLGENDAGEAFDHQQRKTLLAHLLIGLQYLYRLTHAAEPARTPLRVPRAPGRNEPCPCGSGLKFKKCCGAPERLH